ncbi:MAG: hypothetical protein QGI83_19455, partial [Candidatus Latescibacteria bacterium]|nr:hypothetical protein [Candidatus Latescibacterota bacterium]
MPWRRTGRWFASALMLWLPHSVSGAEIASPAEPTPTEETSNLPASSMRPDDVEETILGLESNDWELYPRREAIVMRSIRRLEDGIGLRIGLHSDMPGFSHYTYTTNDGPVVTSGDGTLDIRFEDRGSPEVQRAITVVNAVTGSGARSRAHTVAVHFYPRERYAASGRLEGGHGRVIVQNTDLVMATSRVEDWIHIQPEPDEVDYARSKWGHLMSDDRSDYTNACALARSLVADLDPHRGIPSNEMDRLTPFEQYERVMADKDRLWCGNIAAIFTYACNALGIPCRSVGMRHQYYPLPEDGEGYEVLMAEGHSTTEIFSEALNAWVWMDLTFYIWGAYLGEEGPLNLAELYRYLNIPSRLGR